MGERDRIIASRELVRFVAQTTQVVEGQLKEIQETLGETVTQVFAAIKELAEETKKISDHAEAVLDKTYLSPDAKTEYFTNLVQRSVDALVKDALQTKEAGGDFSLINARLRRFGGLFSKHMEVMSTMDSAVSGELMKMIGTLSNDDVIVQSLEHTIIGLHSLQVSISYILLDFARRFNPEGVAAIKESMLQSSLKLYTTEEEKDLFNKVFKKPSA